MLTLHLCHRVLLCASDTCKIWSWNLIHASVCDGVRCRILKNYVSSCALCADLTDTRVSPVSLLGLIILVGCPRFLIFGLMLSTRGLVNACQHVSIATDRSIITHELLTLAILVLLLIEIVRFLIRLWLLTLFSNEVWWQSTLGRQRRLRSMLLMLSSLNGGWTNLTALNFVVKVSRARSSTLEGIVWDNLIKHLSHLVEVCYKFMSLHGQQPIIWCVMLVSHTVWTMLS